MKNFHKLPIIYFLFLFCTGYSSAQSPNYRFDFHPHSPKTSGKAIRITPDCRYSSDQKYGYDLLSETPQKGKPFCFSVQVPDGDYLVTVQIGSKKQKGNTTVRAESRRLFIENMTTEPGEIRTEHFLIHKRSPRINDTVSVKIKPREKGKLDWDDKLTFEINGSAPALSALSIEPVPYKYTTLFLCGNSTVVNQDDEPWASWGQMIPRFFSEKVCIANYGESGESATSFIASNRQKKVLSLIKPGDYVLVEFGHNDEKIKGPGKGPYTSFTEDMRTFVTESRKRGGIPVLITPTERRLFTKDGTLQTTHGDYPDATRKLAAEEKTALIDLTALTYTLYETWGQEESKQAFVHYPAHTFPNQEKALADNTHFNPYGAYEIAKCVLQGICDNRLKVAQEIIDFEQFDPHTPDAIDTFQWIRSPFIELEKPEGN